MSYLTLTKAGITVASSGGPTLGYTTNLYAWYKADAIVGLNDGDPVGTWADSSGNNRDLTQGTAGYKPLYKTSILNSLPAVRFDGSDDKLDSGTFNLSQPFTYFFVCKALDGGSHLFFANVGSRGDIFREGATSTYVNFGAQDTLGTFNWNTNFVYCMLKVNATSSVFRFSGTDSATPNLGTNSLVVFRLGDNVGGYEPNIDYCEFLIYNEAISDANRATVETYLTAKYGL